MPIPHARASDTTPVVMYLHADSCTAAETAKYLSGLGISIAEADLSGASSQREVGVWEVPVLLMGQQVLDWPESFNTLCGQLEQGGDDRLIIMMTNRVLTFDERLRLSALGNVRITSVLDDSKRVRDMIRDWMRDITMAGYRVLLVEDSNTDAYLAKSFMESVGVEVQRIESATGVLNAIESFQPDLIISDLHMPDCEGDQMARIIRQDREATMPIIFLSAESNIEKQLFALGSGADGFIRKPLHEQPFIKVLKSTIRRSVALENRMRRDPLTNLLNRAQFDTNMRRMAERGETCALAVVDIDHFKQVNDNYGHPVGDQVICRLAKLLEDGVRSSDYVGRMGGEEFALLMPACDLDNADMVLNRLREQFNQTVFRCDNGEVFRCTFSGGMVDLGRDFVSAYKKADDALYESKKMGRNRVTVRPAV
ncbi:diguanylate cyclase [Pseudomonas syringae]|uniref:GGDEF domain-containing response regulator n=1 Tax=Pseudomonas syringae TaxID=317 RepID=UPI001F21218C|nr:diguanylate cyclase [Pseudomonas syringae]MCF5381964.1 diguanylate cyclase [Pseudomonas syringae]MCF5419504.1 diguanylate cyclase [Pseudomonas syringae]MCF5454718.1 diguanylate cyclase [Pseudomonas syringae]MCF5456336.1 diguanylate cyclase [Pseudomonas syringae]